MSSYRLTLEYDGTRYHGWQEQKNARTVAGALRSAIEQVGGPVLELVGAGRTDSGVHALAQVAHLRLRHHLQASGLVEAVNEALPADIHVLGAVRTDDRFHARHAALARSYLYQITRRRTALAKRHVWWVKRPIEIRRMREGLTLLPGRHDYALFCDRPQDQTSTLVHVEAAELIEAGALVVIRLVASHFLWKMVRRVVGTLVQLGTGAIDLATFARLLDGVPIPSRGEGPAQWTAPSSGLFLEAVRYPGDPPLLPLGPVTPVPLGPGQVGPSRRRRGSATRR